MQPKLWCSPRNIIFIVCSYGISFHYYADDTQIYIPIGSKDSPEIQKVKSCLTAIKRWVSQNYLQLNMGKTEMIIIGQNTNEHNLNMSHCALRDLLFPKSQRILKLILSEAGNQF